VIEGAEGPELIRAFYKAITTVTVLDPTVGSGAFLFAALNILEPLYESCLDRMQSFVDEIPYNASPQKYSDIKKILAKLDSHPSREYFIYKSIIVNNLYGVDILEEAVEICKLRLFLKLVAQIEAVDELEPLPDVDFNIRAGNTLVGYTKMEEVKNGVAADLFAGKEADKIMERIVKQVENVEGLFKVFRKSQIDDDPSAPMFKRDLQEKLKEVEEELDRYLAREYGIDHSDEEEFDLWLTSHQPFHWFVEFYGILSKGGFDVVIGNPPYIEYSKVKKQYIILNYKTEKCGNLYAFCMERSFNLLSNDRYCSMIIPMSGFCTDRMNLLKEFILEKSNSHIPYFGNRPATLFNGAQQNLAIPICKINYGKNHSFSTKHNRWYSNERINLFSTIVYSKNEVNNLYKKTGREISKSIFLKISEFPNLNSFEYKKGRYSVYYSNAAGYWLHSIKNLINENISKDKLLKLDNQRIQILFSSILNSSLFFMYWQSIGDCYHITNKETHSIGIPIQNYIKEIEKVYMKLIDDFKNKMLVVEKREKTGLTKQEEFYPKLSKHIIDKIDKVLAEHYGFTQEELDFIINYDIKYRMGKELNN